MENKGGMVMNNNLNVDVILQHFTRLYPLE